MCHFFWNLISTRIPDSKREEPYWRLISMAKEGATYVCDICQQIIVVKKAGAGTLVCCNQPMRLYEGD